MHIPGYHGAIPVSFIHGYRNNSSGYFAIRPLCPPLLLSTEITTIPRAFLSVEYSVLPPTFVFPTTLYKPRLYLTLIIILLCLCPITCVAVTGEFHRTESNSSGFSEDSLQSGPSLVLNTSMQMTRDPTTILERADTHTAEFQALFQPRKRRKREETYSSDTSEPKELTSEMAEFICHRLPDSCARAAYLRQHVRHPICHELPLLYLLPYVSQWINGSFSLSASRTSSCNGGLRNLVYAKSDSVFEPWLTPSATCERSLSDLSKLLDALEPELNGFNEILDKSFCKASPCRDSNESGEFCCEECSKAYKNWLCAVEFPLFVPLNGLLQSHVGSPFFPDTNCFSSKLESVRLRYKQSASFADFFSRTSPEASKFASKFPSVSRSDRSTFQLVAVCPHDYWCTLVETSCPYLNPSNHTANGGEPLFLCHESHYHRSSLYQHPASQQCPVDCRYTEADLRMLSMSSSNMSSACETLQTRCRLYYHSAFVPAGSDTLTLSDQLQSTTADGASDSNSSSLTSSASGLRHFRVHNLVYCWCLLPIILYMLYPYLILSCRSQHSANLSAIPVRTSLITVTLDCLHCRSHSDYSNSIR